MAAWEIYLIANCGYSSKTRMPMLLEKSTQRRWVLKTTISCLFSQDWKSQVWVYDLVLGSRNWCPHQKFYWPYHAHQGHGCVLTTAWWSLYVDTHHTEPSRSISLIYNYFELIISEESFLLFIFWQKQCANLSVSWQKTSLFRCL